VGSPQILSPAASGAGVNPARAIGPMILAGQFSDWWAYLAAPVAGGVAAVALYDRFLRAGRAPA
jgi:glycerol uptake facilitator-like aquaporin